MHNIAVLSSPVKKEGLDRKAAAQLRNAVLSGDLAPGARVTEQAIASQLGLSRGTVRAALHRLVSEGLIVQNVYASWEVMRLTAEDADELYELRASLEGLAGRLAAGKMTTSNHERLSTAYQALVDVAKTGSGVALADADLNLHRTIVEISGNKRLIHHYHQVEMQLRMYIASVNGLLPSPQVVAAVHEPLVKATLAGDRCEAERLLIEHSEFYGQKLVALLSQEEQSAAVIEQQ